MQALNEISGRSSQLFTKVQSATLRNALERGKMNKNRQIKPGSW